MKTFCKVNEDIFLRGDKTKLLIFVNKKYYTKKIVGIIKHLVLLLQSSSPACSVTLITCSSWISFLQLYIVFPDLLSPWDLLLKTKTSHKKHKTGNWQLVVWEIMTVHIKQPILNANSIMGVPSFWSMGGQIRNFL